MLEELWTLLQAGLGKLAEIPSAILDVVVGLASAAAGLIEDLGEATGYEEGLFLPAGRGAAILILGGIAVAAISLSIALYTPRTKLPGSQPSTASGGSGPGTNGTGRSWARFSKAPAGPRPDPAWLEGVRKAVSETDVGGVVLLSERSGRQAVAVPACSGREARQGAPTCEHARELIQAGVRASAPQGQVMAVSCRAQGARACVFEILTGGAPS